MATSSPRPISTSAWPCWRSPTAARSRGRARSASAAGAPQPDRRDPSDPGCQGRGDRDRRPRISTRRSSASGTARSRRPSSSSEYLRTNGSSIRSLRRQIEGEMAWQRLQRAKIESGVSVGDDEVKAVLDRLNASKGTEEYPRRRDLPVGDVGTTAAGPCATPTGSSSSFARAARPSPLMLANIPKRRRRRSAATSAGSARTASRRAARGAVQSMARERSAIRSRSRRRFDPRGPGHAQDPDRRSARCRAQPEAGVRSASPGNDAAAQAEPIVARFAQAAQNVGGCGGADKIAADFNGEVVRATRSDPRSAACAAGNHAADAGRPGDATLSARSRKASGSWSSAAATRSTRRRRPSTRSSTRSTKSG